MPGERLAKITIRAQNTNIFVFGGYLRLRLHGTWVRFTPSTRNFRTPGPEDNYEYIARIAGQSNPTLAQCVDALLVAIQLAITDHTVAYTLSAKRVDGQGTDGSDRYAFEVQAAVYESSYDLAMTTVVNSNRAIDTFGEILNLPTIRPVLVQVTVTPATIFNSPTGAIQLVASNGNTGLYTYAWGDGPTTASRLNVVGPATYTCTVTDASGAYAVALAIVGSDPRLDVRVERSENDVTLVPSGGLPGYTYAWADGPTTATRLALTAGTYPATVTDARGASVTVSVTIDSYRYYWSKNPITLSLDAGAAYRANPSTKPNLSYLCEVWVEETYLSGTFVQLGSTLEQPADREGRTVFDAQALLDTYLSEHLPTLNQAQPSRADSLFRRFYFRYAEKFGTPPVAAALSSQVRHYVLLGGLGFYEVGASRWLAYQAAVKPFLTWEPNDKRVLPTQPEYLYFMVDSLTLTSFQVHLRVAYADGSRAEQVLATVPGVKRFEVYCLPAGYQQLGLAPPVLSSASAVVHWDIWVTDPQGAIQTEVRRYVLDTSYVAKPRYLLYTNSLGGSSTLACVGDAKTALEVTGEEAARPLGAGYTPLLGDTLLLDRSGVPTLSLATGPLSRAQLVTVQELLLSRRVTLQSDETYFAGRVKPKTTTLREESPGEVVAAEVDFVLVRQRQFSPRLPAVPRTALAGGEGAQP